MPTPSSIAIDGPVAVGKSSVGGLLARRLGYRFVDTGMMYRALTWQALERGLDLADETALTDLAARTRIDLAAADNNATAILVDGRDVTGEIRSPDVERAVSLVSRVPGVREHLVEQQRRLGRDGGIVMAGRDIGTVVLPEAELKLFLEASAEERARRRHLELRGHRAPDYNTILSDLKRRDEIDSNRSVSPLKAAADSRQIDTDALTLEQVVDIIMALMED